MLLFVHLLHSEACHDAGVTVAGSEIAPGILGLFPAKDFAAGDIIFSSTASVDTAWVPESDVTDKIPDANTVEVILTDPCRATKQVMLLRGDPARHPWAVMNSCIGSATEANVEPVLTEGPMHEEFLTFRAVCNIKAFECELTWKYNVAFHSADNPSAEPGWCSPERYKRSASFIEESPAKVPRETITKEDVQDMSLTRADEQLPAAADAATAHETHVVAEASGDPTKAVVSGPAGDALAALVHVPPRPEPLNMEYVKQFGQKLGDLEKPKRSVWYLPVSGHSAGDSGDIAVLFEKPAKKITPCILHTFAGGSVMNNQAWTNVPYSLTRKTRVVGSGGEIVNMEDLMGKAVQRVYGYQDKHLTKQADTNHHWVPRPPDLPMVEAFLHIPSAKPLFVMQLNTESATGKLAPAGVAFRLSQTFSWSNESNCVLLSGAA